MCVQTVALVVAICFLKDEKQSSVVVSSKSHTEGGAFGIRDSQGFNIEALWNRPCFWKVEETTERGGRDGRDGDHGEDAPHPQRLTQTILTRATSAQFFIQ